MDVIFWLNGWSVYSQVSHKGSISQCVQFNKCPSSTHCCHNVSDSCNIKAAFTMFGNFVLAISVLACIVAIALKQHVGNIRNVAATLAQQLMLFGLVLLSNVFGFITGIYLFAHKFENSSGDSRKDIKIEEMGGATLKSIEKGILWVKVRFYCVLGRHSLIATKLCTLYRLISLIVDCSLCSMFTFIQPQTSSTSELVYLCSTDRLVVLFTSALLLFFAW